MAAERIDDILIVGGGHAGLLAGAMLARAGFGVRLIERTSPAAIADARPDGRSLALLAGSVRVVERAGLWPFIAGSGAAVWRTEVTEGVTGRRIGYDVARDDAPFGFGFENHALRRGLLEAFLHVAGAERYRQGEVAEIGRDGEAAWVRLGGGERLRARLLIGADGRRSRLRALARIGARTWSYGQAALTLVVAHTRPHGHVVREWLRPEGPLALLPLPGQRSGVTWVEPAERAPERLAEGADALLRRLDRITGRALGGLALVSGPALYPLAALHAERYVAPRLALIGDAAHGVHPIHAQGFNMGVADVGALVEALAAARACGLDPGSGDALLPYARRRRPANDRRLLLTDVLNRVFSNAIPPIAQARGLALAAVDAVAPLKRIAIRHGMQLD